MRNHIPVLCSLYSETRAQGFLRNPLGLRLESARIPSGFQSLLAPLPVGIRAAVGLDLGR